MRQISRREELGLVAGRLAAMWRFVPVKAKGNIHAPLEVRDGIESMSATET